MKRNPVIDTLLDHKSIREYTEETPSEEEIDTIVRAGQQAPFVSQLYSLMLSRDRERHPFEAPLLFTVCVDVHKMEKIMEKRDWKMITNDLSMLLFGIQDAAYMAQNMVVAGESLGIGSCFLGGAIYKAKKIRERYDLPNKVFPLVQLAMGYPAEDPPARPRYPRDFVLFEDRYPDLDDDLLDEAMERMDQGYLEQDYYRKLDAKISLKGDREDEHDYEDYSWTEHISRKWGQWYESKEKPLEQLEISGFDITIGDE